MSTVDLSVPPPVKLSQRRSEKWSLFDADVLSLTVAEMDFPMMAEIRAAIVATVEGSDLGYGVPAPGRLREVFAAFAERRLSWRLRPDQVTVVPDVMLGLSSCVGISLGLAAGWVSRRRPTRRSFVSRRSLVCCLCPSRCRRMTRSMLTR